MGSRACAITTTGAVRQSNDGLTLELLRTQATRQRRRRSVVVQIGTLNEGMPFVDATGRYEITWFLGMKIPANLEVFRRASGDEDVASPRGAMSD